MPLKKKKASPPPPARRGGSAPRARSASKGRPRSDSVQSDSSAYSVRATKSEYISSGTLLIRDRLIATMGMARVFFPVLREDHFIKADDHFAEVLAELEKHKEQLGASGDTRQPKINYKDSEQFMFGVPVAAVKDWIAMAIKNKWRPSRFWKFVGGEFGVADSQRSAYEEASVSIQRFGLLIANKARFFNILASENEERYFELGRITGLAWHPKQNSAGTEKIYINFIEDFLTVHFENARRQGTAALIDYFKAFHGVCLEDRARNLEEYALAHPIAGAEYVEEIAQIADYDSSGTAENAFLQEVRSLFDKLGAAPSPEALYEHLVANGVFDREFTTADGAHKKPSKQDYYDWAQQQVEWSILDAPEGWTPPQEGQLPTRRVPPPVPQRPPKSKSQQNTEKQEHTSIQNVSERASGKPKEELEFQRLAARLRSERMWRQEKNINTDENPNKIGPTKNR